MCEVIQQWVVKKNNVLWVPELETTDDGMTFFRVNPLDRKFVHIMLGRALDYTSDDGGQYRVRTTVRNDLRYVLKLKQLRTKACRKAVKDILEGNQNDSEPHGKKRKLRAARASDNVLCPHVVVDMGGHLTTVKYGLTGDVWVHFTEENLRNLISAVQSDAEESDEESS